MKKILFLLFALFIFSGSFAQIGPITGDSTICTGSGTILSDTSGGGVWSSSDPSVATIGISTGNVTGLLAGTTVISYTISSSLYATFVLTVNTSPGPISGVSMVFTGDSIVLTDVVAGGIWTSSDTAIASANIAAGIVRGLSSGGVYISYTLGNGCYAVDSITVYNLATSLTGPGKVCTGDTITLTDLIPDGTWTSSDTTIATVDSGIVTGIAAGTATITYTIDTNYVTQVVTVNASPGAVYDPYTGSFFMICDDPPDPISTTLTDTTSGGMWSSDTSLAYIDSVGFLTLNPVWLYAITVPNDTVVYTVPNGCYVTAVVHIFFCEGIPTIPNTNDISIFPNPAHDELTIQSSHDVIHHILITNLLGQTVSLQTAPASCLLFEADVSELSPGVYFVKVNGGDASAGLSMTQKFVKE